MGGGGQKDNDVAGDVDLVRFSSHRRQDPTGLGAVHLEVTGSLHNVNVRRK